MKSRRSNPSRIRSLLLVAVLAPEWMLASPGGASIRDKKEDAAGFKEFLARVQDYVQLHKSVEATLPPLKQTDLPELITAHQQALARKIREARPAARPGNIFTHGAREAFRHEIRRHFRSPQAPAARATIQKGDPVKKVRLEVNQVYPDGLPFTTVPPTLLLKLPRLPDDVAYRIVAHDLVLLDVKANLVLDVIPGVLP